MQSVSTAASDHRRTEAGLIARARLGDENAIRVLVQQNNRRLYRVARAVLGDDREAEDAVQEAYLRAFTHLGGFRGDSGFASWLTRIAERGAAATAHPAPHHFARSEHRSAWRPEQR